MCSHRYATCASRLPRLFYVILTELTAGTLSSPFDEQFRGSESARGLSIQLVSALRGGLLGGDPSQFRLRFDNVVIRRPDMRLGH